MSAISQIPAQIPDWLRIKKVDEQHYQLTDISVESIGLCLGVFHSREAAQQLADKIAKTHGPNYSPKRPKLVGGFASDGADNSVNKWIATMTHGATTRLAADWRETLSLRGLMSSSKNAAQEDSV